MHFDFAAKPSYRKIWAGFALVSAGLLAVGAWRAYQIDQERKLVAEQTRQAQTQRSLVQAPSRVLAPQQSAAYNKQASQAAQLLQTDLNKALTALEAIKIPNARLQSLTINAAQNLVEVEYEFSQLGQAADISEALIGGYSKPPWRLVGTQAKGGNQQGTGAGAGFTGRWQAKLDQL